MVTQSPAFKTAVTDSRKLKAKPNNEELLEVCSHPTLFYPKINSI
jgi:acyl-CoA-binding protein